MRSSVGIGLPLRAPAVLLACVGGLAFLFRVGLSRFAALGSIHLCMPNHPVSLTLCLVCPFGCGTSFRASAGTVDCSCLLLQQTC